jgi:hypothetical protein
LAEEIEEPLLLVRRIAATRDFELDLATEGYGVDFLGWRSIPDAQLEGKHGHGCEWDHAGALDFEAEVRHSGLP